MSHLKNLLEDLRVSTGLVETSQMGLDFAVTTSKRKPPRQRRTRGKGGLPPDQIVKILEVKDTRQYEEIDDRWVPIRGSGQESWCARCGRPHEVLATVELADKRTAVVGTGCMKGSRLEKEGNRGASAAKAIAKLEAEIADLEMRAKRYKTIMAQVNKMRVPDPVPDKPNARGWARWRIDDAVATEYPLAGVGPAKQNVVTMWKALRRNERGSSARDESAERGLRDRRAQLAKKKALLKRAIK